MNKSVRTQRDLCYVPSTFVGCSSVSLATGFDCSSWTSPAAATGDFGLSAGTRISDLVGSSLIQVELSIEFHHRHLQLNKQLLHYHHYIHSNWFQFFFNNFFF